MNHVERIGGEFPGQPAQQRHELHIARRRLRHLFDEGRQRASVANADDLVLAAFEDLAQEACSLECQRLQRQVALAEIRRDAAERKPVALGQRVFQRHAFRHRTFDKDADHPLAARARDQAVRLGALDVEAACDLRLGQPGGEIEPRRARRERRFAIDHGQPVGRESHARKTSLANFFTSCKKLQRLTGASIPQTCCSAIACPAAIAWSAGETQVKTNDRIVPRH